MHWLYACGGGFDLGRSWQRAAGAAGGSQREGEADGGRPGRETRIVGEHDLADERSAELDDLESFRRARDLANDRRPAHRVRDAVRQVVLWKGMRFAHTGFT